MTVDWMLVATVATPVVCVILGAYITRAVENRPRVVTYYGHVSAHRVSLDTGPMIVNTHDVVVRNGGRRAATNVRLGHHVLPVNYQVSPSIEHSVNAVSGGLNTEVVFPTLVPGEQVTVSYLYFPPLTYDQVNSYVKSDEGFAKVITVLPQTQYPQWVTRTVGAFTLLGFLSALYLMALSAIRWLSW